MIAETKVESQNRRAAGKRYLPSFPRLCGRSSRAKAKQADAAPRPPREPTWKRKAGRCLKLFLSHRQSQVHGPEREREREKRDKVNSLLVQIIGHSKQALPGRAEPAHPSA